MFVHAFGAYFGLAVSYMITPKNITKKNENIGSNYNSNLFAAIGTVFLFMYWPSFNGVFATGNSQHRVVVNTVLAICASTLGAFYISTVISVGQFNMEDILNATLAGGVIVGSSSDLVAASWVSILIGFFGGAVSCFCYKKLSPELEEHIGLHDTCGVHNLHGIPGVLGGMFGGISAHMASANVYGDNLNTVFPELADGRSQKEQSAYQFLCLGATLGIAIVGGLLTGAIIRLPFFEGPIAEDMFDDKMWWTMEPEEDPIDKRLTRAKIE